MISKIYAKNRPSPYNEDAYIDAYKRLNPDATKKDHLDIACVISINDIYGHALMDPEDNRSRDNAYHIVYDFIPDYILERYM